VRRKELYYLGVIRTGVHTRVDSALVRLKRIGTENETIREQQPIGFLKQSPVCSRGCVCRNARQRAADDCDAMLAREKHVSFPLYPDWLERSRAKGAFSHTQDVIRTEAWSISCSRQIGDVEKQLQGDLKLFKCFVVGSLEVGP
jgi:hypothetical protein